MTIGEKASEYAEKCFPSDDIVIMLTYSHG